MVLVMELINAMVARYEGVSVFAGIGERSREGHELLTDMRTSGVIAKTVLVFGQMNEPPGARWRVDARERSRGAPGADRLGRGRIGDRDRRGLCACG